MRQASSLIARHLVTVMLIAGAGAAAGDEREQPRAAAPVQLEPCGFYRGQAFGRGLDHFATEMLWACEAIEARSRTRAGLSERLAAVEGALARYREAVIEAGLAAFARDRTQRGHGGQLGAGDAVKAELAESTGMLAALEAIRSGF